MRFLLILVGLVIAGMITIWALGHLLSLIGYLIVGALVVGGAYYVIGRVRRGIASGRYRRITR
jgi:hypothetical protein